jgi:hypothetical protein
MNAPAIRLNLLPGGRPPLRLVQKSCAPVVEHEGASEAGNFMAKSSSTRDGSKRDTDALIERIESTFEHVQSAVFEALDTNADPDVLLCLRLSEHYLGRAEALYADPAAAESTRAAVRLHWSNVLALGRTDQEKRAKTIERIVKYFEDWTPRNPDDKAAACRALQQCRRAFAHDAELVSKLNVEIDPGTEHTTEQSKLWELAAAFVAACRSGNKANRRKSGNAFLKAIGFEPTGDGWRNTPMYLLEKRTTKNPGK